MKTLFVTLFVGILFLLPNKVLASTDFSNYSKLWSVPITADLSPYLFRSAPVANDSGMVFAGSEKKVIGATNTGVRVWEYSDVSLYPQLILAGDKVIVLRTNFDSQLIALNQEDGEVIWKTPIFAEQILVQSNPQVLDDKIFVAFNTYNPFRAMLKTYDTSTGKELRSVTQNASQYQFSSLAGPILTDFALPHQSSSSAKVFVALQQGYLDSVTRTMLSVRVDRSDLGPFPEAPVLSNDDSYLLTSSGAILRYFKVKTDGTSYVNSVWTTNLGKVIRARPLLTTDYAIVNVGDSGQPGELVAVSLKDGKVAWRKSLAVGVSTTPTLFDAQTLILSADKLYFLDLASGASLSEFSLDHKLGNRFSGPLSVGVKTFLIDKDGNLVCFGPPAPLHHPAIFVHGLGGSPADWEIGGNKEGYKIKLLEKYQADRPNFPVDWLVAYSYAGTDAKTGGYNSGGRVEEVAANFEQTVATLSAGHLKAGGNGLVDVVAFSMGGLVTREYMASHPDSTHLRKVITIGTPHQGSYWANIVQGFDSSSLSPQYKQNVYDSLQSLASEFGYKLPVGTAAIEDLSVGSEYVNNLKQRNVKAPVIFNTIAGDLSVQIEQGVLFYTIKAEPLDVGDLIVSKYSASTPDPVETDEQLVYSQNLHVPLLFVKNGSNLGVRFQVPRIAALKYFHMLLPNQPEVQERVTDELVGIPEEDSLRV